MAGLNKVLMKFQSSELIDISRENFILRNSLNMRYMAFYNIYSYSAASTILVINIKYET